MKRVLKVLALVFLMGSSAFALSDAEFLKMRRNSVAFARADKNLSRVWISLKKSLPASVFSRLQADQREWIASGRDDAADAYMDEGYTRVEAYTMATNDRADELPAIAKRLRSSGTQSRPKVTPKPKPKPEPEPEPEPEPVTSNYGDDEDEEIADVSGEYESSSAFMTVTIIDRSTMELEAEFGRWKDGVNWKSRGWLEGNTLELSDSQYSRCVMTITFTGKGAKVTLSDSDDWAKATADDFVMAGTYNKK